MPTTYPSTSAWGYAPSPLRQPTHPGVRRQFSSPLVQAFVDSFDGDGTAERWYSPDEPHPTADVIVLLSLVLLCTGLSLLVGLTIDASFYERLATPSWAAPGWAFAPVTTVLYAAMGVAAWMVWRTADTVERNAGIGWFAGQFVLSLAWTPIFFGAHAIGTAMLLLVVLFAMIAATVAAFWTVRRSAALMMLPYLGVVGYLTGLNAAIWALN